MEKEKFDFFRNLLHNRLENLVNEAGKTMVNMMGEGESLADLTDRASLENYWDSLLNIRERERNLIHKIIEALDRIKDGTYGICEECDEEITEQRLKARPITTLCIECKTAQEAEEQFRGDGQSRSNPMPFSRSGLSY